MKAIMNAEDYFYQNAINNGKNAIVFCDRLIFSYNKFRGVFDPRAYMEES